MRVDEAQAREGVAMTEDSGRNPLRAGYGAEASTAAAGRTKPEVRLMEAVVERSNLWLAYDRVVQNQGAPGVDGLTVGRFKDWLKVNWPSIRVALLEGRYMPAPVRAVDIPKPQGGKRTLGIPTVVDRLTQQALLQVLQPLFEPGFSASSYGFRPGRSAQQAVLRARQYVREGRRWVVDIDLEKFFDRVNHDKLMSRVARVVEDERVLKLIRRYLEAGLMRDGLMSVRTEGTPQGGPLSPLLSNVMLTDLDRELERRGLAFCRYADDCNIYVRSKAAGEHAMAELTSFLEGRLKLRINAAKSAVARPWARMFLGYSLTHQREPKLCIAESSIQRLKGRLRELMRTGRGRSLPHTISELNPLLRGWINYFKLTETKRVLEELDGWIRRKLRCLLWRHWKRPYTRQKMLQQRGLPKERAWRSTSNGRGPWWNAGASHMHAAFPQRFFAGLGLVSLLDSRQRFPILS
jgi:RNA-directed DNA polymerase